LVATGSGDPLATASDQPRYRYGYLVEQARQRASLAKQLGDALLGALKERDQAAYDLFLAENARELAGATRELKDLVRTESRDAKAVADVQADRARDNQTFWNNRIANNPDGMSDLERQALGYLAASGWLQFSSAMVNFATALPAAIAAFAGAGLSAGSIGTTAGTAGVALPAGLAGFAAGSVIWSAALAAGGQPIASGLQGLAGWLGTAANEKLTQAGFERRWEEWNLQNTLANYDAQIADLQVTLAQDRVDISDKDYEIAGLQYTHAQRVYEFLQNKTLNKELYEWMVSVLIEQYRAVMQSAAAAAQLAQRALEFEWQAPVTIVKGDYWTVDAPSLREDQKGYGLLGAERLLTDLTRLDDFRLSADKRRLQLSKTISLAQRFPSDFVKLQQTGRIEFDTLIDWFDEDFPGHYLRLIKSVRVSVLALVPPIDGIHAMLSNSGASTAIFPDRPPQRSLRTFGESIALDSPYNESGLFVLEYNDPMLLPFEGLGVESHWVFELPRASNRLNFDTIADVLFTIEYTALQDSAYADRVRQRLGTSRSANSVLSLRTSFPDQWYHLQNPLDGTQPQVVTLNIPRTFFSPNLQNLLLKHLTMILLPADSIGIQTLRNRLPQNAIRVTVGGVSVNVDGNGIDQNSGSITTMRPGQPGAGNPLFNDPTFDGQNVLPFGSWEVRFASDLYTPDANNVRTLDLVADILLIPTVEGDIG
jgi:Tc toxin complex TcA C-terminal TcB-binding domain